MEYTVSTTTPGVPIPPREPMSSPLADFLRYHVLIRVFQGHTGEWLDLLRKTARGESDDARFLRWLQQKLDSDPWLLDEIRGMVDGSGLWPGESQLSG